MSLFQQVSPAEAAFVRRYFDAIDHAISRELVSGETAYEEFLTATLGRLMDQKSPFQALLEYPLRALNEDLEKCGSGNQVLVEFGKRWTNRIPDQELLILARSRF